MAEVNPTDAIDFDRSVIGVEVEVGTHEADKERMMAYARALGETNPLYLDEEAAKAGYAPHAVDPDAAARLWRSSEELLGDRVDL